MATRAQEFKAAQMRKAQQKKPPAAKAKKPPKQWKPPAERHARGTELGLENESKRGAKKALVAMEENASGKRSRKSTRGSSNKGKNSSAIEMASRQRLAQASARHSRRG